MKNILKKGDAVNIDSMEQYYRIVKEIKAMNISISSCVENLDISFPNISINSLGEVDSLSLRKCMGGEINKINNTLKDNGREWMSESFADKGRNWMSEELFLQRAKNLVNSLKITIS